MRVVAGINGFGRIGRAVLRAWVESGRDDVDIVAVNSRADIGVAAHLLQYDSTHGRFDAEVKIVGDDCLQINGRNIQYSRHTSIEEIDWQKSGAKLIMECAGVFNSRPQAVRHISAGASRVLISAPAKDADITTVYGINHNLLAEQEVVSAASCTTNCLAPIASSLNDNFGIVCGWMSTVHAMTSDQKLLDESHKDLRRARAAGASIIPTKTGAAEAIGLVIPELAGKLSGVSLRVPVANVSLVDLTCQLAKTATADDINAALRLTAKNMPAGVMGINDAPLVSSDFNHSSYSAIADVTQTRVINNLAKVMAWYDNEWGFACRMLDIAALMQPIK
ncbi:MAG: type I glyceraldehyde-3-phosphate dehydrogenase [Gammaproteobacteria bacterium WSBS_2016_MAG_OTU1]